MATLYIPLRATPENRSSEFEVELDGIRIRLRSYYASINKRWFLDTRDLEDNLIVGSLALVPGVDLWRPYKHLAIPKGELFLSNPSSRAPANLDNLDVSALLLYREVS